MIGQNYTPHADHKMLHSYVYSNDHISFIEFNLTMQRAAGFELASSGF